MNIYQIKNLEKENSLSAAEEYRIDNYAIGKTATASIVFKKLNDFKYLQSKGVSIKILLRFQQFIFDIKQALFGQKLSEDVDVLASFEDHPIQGQYDFKNNYLKRLVDSKKNSVEGIRSIEYFPWGVAEVTQNTVKNGILNYKRGTITSNTIADSYILMDSDTSLIYNTIESNSTLKFQETPACD